MEVLLRRLIGLHHLAAACNEQVSCFRNLLRRSVLWLAWRGRRFGREPWLVLLDEGPLVHLLLKH